MSGNRRLLVSAAAVVTVLAVGVPVVAYVIVPQLVRRTVVETAPAATARPTPAVAGPAATAAVETTVTIKAGDLRRVNAVDFGSGRVSILRVGGKRFLRFQDVEIAGAPAQHVYLSDRTDGRPGNFTDLGGLRATNGSFNYDIPDGLDLASVHSVVSWCKQFNTTVTFAVLS